MQCPKCGYKGKQIVKAGIIPTLKGRRQRYRCNRCGKHFYKREK